MKEHIINIKDLTDSRELLEAKPPRIMTVFIYLILFVLLAAFCWAWFGTIDQTIKAPGVIVPKESISIVNNIIGGTVEYINVHDGQPVAKGDVLYAIDSSLLRNELDDNEDKIKKMKLERGHLLKFQESIYEEKNLFSEENIKFHNRYLVYSCNKEKLNLEYLAAKELFDEQDEIPEYLISKNDLEKLESSMRLALLNRDAFISEQKMQLEVELESIEERLPALYKSKDELERQIDLCQVKAAITGNIQIRRDFNTDDFLAAGVEVLQIVPGNDFSYKVSIFVSNKDIIRINPGDTVRYKFPSLLNNEYNLIGGSVVSIPESSDIHNSDGTFIIEGSIPNDVIQTASGNSVLLKSGMYADARIIVGSRKIWFYLLDKLDLL